jgi:hypothetical protein
VKPDPAGVHCSEHVADKYKGRLRRTTQLAAEYRQARMAELMAAGHCGFAGCAVGHATQDPVLQAEGLTLASPYRYAGPMCANGNGHAADWAAVEVFFGLTGAEAHHLFMLESYSEDRERDSEYGEWFDPHPHQVAARIREFVASRSAA